MKFTTLFASAVTAGAVGIVGAPAASAEDTTVTITPIGSEAELVNGSVVQGWTVHGLMPSTDVIPYPVQGTLWEATATDEAIQGSVTPIVSNLNARAENGETYHALFQVATPQGVNPATLAQGQETTGKVYFDVTGAAPSSVVYNSGGQDLIIWQALEVIEDLEVIVVPGEVIIGEDVIIVEPDEVILEEIDATIQAPGIMPPGS